MGEGYELPESLQTVPIRCLGPSASRLLSIYLDPPACILTDDSLVPDASGLAELAGFDHVMIRFFENKPNRTETLLDYWRSRDNGTMGNLVKYLVQLERFDCLTELWGKLVADAQKWLKRRKKNTDKSCESSHMSQNSTSSRIVPCQLPLTTDDVDLGCAQTYTACICCADDDLDLARAIMDNLPDKARLFIPQDNLLSGGYEFETIAEVIEERCGGRIVVILSVHYNLSPACTVATQFVKTLDPDSKRRQIIPILKDEDAEFPRVLRGISMIKFNRCRDMQTFYKHLAQSLRLNTSQSSDVLHKDRCVTTESKPVSHTSLSLLYNSSEILNDEDTNKKGKTAYLSKRNDLSCFSKSNSVGIEQKCMNISLPRQTDDNVYALNTEVMSSRVPIDDNKSSSSGSFPTSTKSSKPVFKVFKAFKDVFRRLEKKEVSKVKNTNVVEDTSSRKSPVYSNSASKHRVKHKSLEQESCDNLRSPTCSSKQRSLSLQSLVLPNKDGACQLSNDMSSDYLFSNDGELKVPKVPRRLSLPAQCVIDNTKTVKTQPSNNQSHPQGVQDKQRQYRQGEPVFELRL